MSEPVRHLRPVQDAEAARAEQEARAIIMDPETGERLMMLADYTQEMRDQLEGAESEVRSWRTKHANLKRDKEAEMKEAPDWPVALGIFTYWRKTCDHDRSAFDSGRYELIHRVLEAHKDGSDKLNPYARAEALCRRAIDGAAFDPFITKRKNGSSKRHDGIDLIFRNADKFEEFCNRAPRGGTNDDDDAQHRPDQPAHDGAGQGEQGSLVPLEAEAGTT